LRTEVFKLSEAHGFFLMLRIKKRTNDPIPRELEVRIHVVFDDIECEVVEAAEAPDGEGEQEGCSPVRLLNQQERRRQQANKQKQKSLGLNPPWVSQIFHFGASLRRLLQS
jgi:hypothetical protein